MRNLYLKIINFIYWSKLWKLKAILTSKKDVKIIMYHDLTDKELFEKQMLYIKRNYKVIGLEDYMELIRHGKEPEDNSMIITFDDGYESTYLIAMPILNELELKATVFVPPAILNDYNKNSKNKMMSIQQLKELSKSKFIDIGGHTLNHVDLGKLEYNEASEEIFMGKKELENILDKEITIFAYPFGKSCNYNKDTIDIVQKSGFIGAVTTNRFKNRNIDKDSIYELNRIGIDNKDTLEIFVIKINKFYPYKSISTMAKLKNVSGV